MTDKVIPEWILIAEETFDQLQITNQKSEYLDRQKSEYLDRYSKLELIDLYMALWENMNEKQKKFEVWKAKDNNTIGSLRDQNSLYLEKINELTATNLKLQGWSIRVNPYVIGI